MNNAILIVHQALNDMRQEAMPHRQAIAESVKSRIRPIYMSSVTTPMAMLPLVLAPGAGFTRYLVPALLSLALDVADRLRQLVRKTESLSRDGANETR